MPKKDTKQKYTRTYQERRDYNVMPNEIETLQGVCCAAAEDSGIVRGGANI